MITPETLREFVRESNHIEGIAGVRPGEVEAHRAFIQLSAPSITDLEVLVAMLEPGARLRTQPNMNVRVGDHIAPRCGPELVSLLSELLRTATEHNRDPYSVHVAYETLHPFTDGNGRSGRALWLWGMERQNLWWPKPSFLHSFYYQALEASRG